MCERKQQDMSDEDELDDPPAPLPGSLAYKLTQLLDQCINPKNGKPYSLPRITRQINDMVDSQFKDLSEEERKRRKLSRTYLWELKTGRKPNPTLDILRSLAAYLDVTVGYLSSDPSSEDEEARHLVRPDLNMRTRGLSPRGIENVLAWIEHARELEGLDRSDSASAATQ
jgi:transcriptional regulator with XRE-family HTH domain